MEALATDQSDLTKEEQGWFLLSYEETIEAGLFDYPRWWMLEKPRTVVPLRATPAPHPTGYDGQDTMAELGAHLPNHPQVKI